MRWVSIVPPSCLPSRQGNSRGSSIWALKEALKKQNTASVCGWGGKDIQPRLRLDDFGGIGLWMHEAVDMDDMRSGVQGHRCRTASLPRRCAHAHAPVCHADEYSEVGQQFLFCLSIPHIYLIVSSIWMLSLYPGASLGDSHVVICRRR
jgi:hypothetical protein